MVELSEEYEEVVCCANDWSWSCITGSSWNNPRGPEGMGSVVACGKDGLRTGGPNRTGDLVLEQVEKHPKEATGHTDKALVAKRY